MKQRFEIYLITNTVNGKRYVGQTTGTVASRWTEHVAASRQGKKRGSPILCAAIRKYGPAAFTCELLDVVTSQNGADIAERVWIEQRFTLAPDGYNLMSGGGGNGRHHEDSKRLISEASKKYFQSLTPEQLAKRKQFLSAAWTPERKARHAALVKSEKVRANVRRGQKEFWAQLTPEERSRRVRHQFANVSPEQKSEIAKKIWANTTPEAREARVAKAVSAAAVTLHSPEHSKKMSDFQTAQAKLRTPEQRVEIAKKSWDTRRAKYGETGMQAKTTEQFSADSKKSWATRRAQGNASVASEHCGKNWVTRRKRYGEKGLKQKETAEQAAERTQKAWETRRAKYGQHGLKQERPRPRGPKLTPEQRSAVAKQNWANRKAKYGQLGAKQKKTPAELAEIGKKIWETRRLNQSKK